MGRGARVLFICYGGGHVEMCLPVMRALRQKMPGCDARIMALTTAFAPAELAGETPLGYRDFIDMPDAARALKFGARLISEAQHSRVAPEESIAYLGFNFLEWVECEGEDAAWQRWAQSGRYGFFPLNFFRNVLRKLEIDVVVTTNSPRSEQAAIEAAVSLGIPCLSMLDLFALPGDPYLTRSVHADRLTVLADATLENLVAAGISPKRIFVTGNPAFDSLVAPFAKALGETWRHVRGWNQKNIILWAGHLEVPHASPATLAGSGLGNKVQQRLADWVESRADVCLVVRYHPNECHAFVKPPIHPRIFWSEPGIEPLLPILLASDQVVVQVTTVGVQAYITGKRVINIGFSPYVQSSGLDYSLLGMSERADDLAMLIGLLEQGLAVDSISKPELVQDGRAAQAVASHICTLVKERFSL